MENNSCVHVMNLSFSMEMATRAESAAYLFLNISSLLFLLQSALNEAFVDCIAKHLELKTSLKNEQHDSELEARAKGMKHKEMDIKNL